jgi:hypothetical protein
VTRREAALAAEAKLATFLAEFSPSLWADEQLTLTKALHVLRDYAR